MHHHHGNVYCRMELAEKTKKQSTRGGSGSGGKGGNGGSGGGGMVAAAVQHCHGFVP